MGEEILSWCFERLYSPLYDRVEKHCGKIAALITTLAIAVALLLLLPIVVFAALREFGS